MSSTAPDLAEMITELARVLRPEQAETGFRGQTPAWFGPQVFGGFLVAQAVHAAGLTVEADRRIHSLHVYFVRTAAAGIDLHHTVDRVRDGRSFAVRRVDTLQQDRTVFQMSCSYTLEPPLGDGLAELDPAVPGPDGAERDRWGGPWEWVRIGPGGGSSSRAWVRAAARMPDDPLLHDSVVALMTDMTAGGGDPVPGFSPRQMVSLDHAVWFHRHPRADEWLYYDIRLLARSGDRAVIHGTMYGPDRRAAVTVAQEVLLRTA